MTWVPDEVVVERLVARNGLSHDAARARLAAQLPLGTRLARADVAVDTSGDMAATREVLSGHWRALLQQLATPAPSLRGSGAEAGGR